jgi:hypothetical protein
MLINLPGLSLPRIGSTVTPGAGPASPTQPTDVAGLFGWWSTDVLYGLGYRLGDSIKTLSDKSGNGRDFVSPSTGALYDPGGLKGYPYLLCGGLVGYYQNVASFAALTAGHAFMVVRQYSDPPVPPDEGLWNFGALAAGTGDVYPSFVDGHVYLSFLTNTLEDCGDWADDLGAWHILEVYAETNNMRAYYNSTSRFNTAVYTIAAPTYPLLAARYPVVPAAIRFHELLLFDHVLSAGDQTLMRDYLAGKYF